MSFFKNLQMVFTESYDSIVKEKIRISIIVLLAIIFGIFSFFLKAQGGKYSEYLADLCLNVSAGFLGAIVMFLILDNGIKRINKLEFSGIREHPYLPLNTFMNSVSRSRNNVCILDIWMYSLVYELGNWAILQEAIISAIRNNVEVKILCAAPDENAAMQRAIELEEAGKGDRYEIIKKMKLCLKMLYDFKKNLVISQCINNEFFEVRLYADLPSISMHLWDDSAFWSFYPSGEVSSKNKQLQIPVNSPLGKYLSSKFNELWHNHDTVKLDGRHFE